MSIGSISFKKYIFLFIFYFSWKSFLLQRHIAEFLQQICYSVSSDGVPQIIFTLKILIEYDVLLSDDLFLEFIDTKYLYVVVVHDLEI